MDYIGVMGMSVQITTPMPSADEVADSLGLSKARRKFLSELASTAKVHSSIKSRRITTTAQKSLGHKSNAKKVY
jgi:hypothetical protein